MIDSKCNNHLKLQSRFAGMVFADCQGHAEFQIISTGNAHRRSQSGGFLSSLGDPVLSFSKQTTRGHRHAAGDGLLSEAPVQKPGILAGRSGGQSDKPLSVF